MTDKTHSPAPADLLHMLRAHIVWLAFGECRSRGWAGEPPTARAAVDAIDAALSAATTAPARDHAAELAAALGWPAGISAPPVWDDLLREAARLRVATPVATDTKWDGAEEWMPLAWELCAEENGEEACSELVWEGGPIKEPWGDRWLKYEDEAKRLIALVRKCVPALTAPQAPQQAELTDEQLDALAMDDDGLPNSHLEFARAVIAADRAIRSPGMTDAIQQAVAAERERCLSIIEAHQVPVGNSAAGEMAAEWTMDALREVRDAIRSDPQVTQIEACTYPACGCPFDAPADPAWCAKGLPQSATPALQCSHGDHNQCALMWCQGHRKCAKSNLPATQTGGGNG